MTLRILKKWMEANGWNANKVGVFLGIDPSTIRRFLAGGNCHPSTLKALERLVSMTPDEHAEQSRSVG